MFWMDQKNLSETQRYWLACAHRELEVQRLEDRYIILQSSWYDRSARKKLVYNVLELPLRASDAQFARKLDAALHPVYDGFKTDRKLAIATRKLKYFGEVENELGGYNELRNRWGATHATISLSVSYNALRVSARWAYELKYERRFPTMTTLSDIVIALRSAFEIAEQPPKTRFAYGARIGIVRTETDYVFERLCVADFGVRPYGVAETSIASTDDKLGAALLSAMTDLPRLSEREFSAAEKRFQKQYEHFSELSGQHLNGRLEWEGADDPEHLCFVVTPPTRAGGLMWTVPVEATEKAVGKLVRDGFTKFVVAHRKRPGLSNEKLFARLERLQTFELTRRKAAMRNKVLKDGWPAIIDSAIGRFFLADAEDLAEGGVAALLSKEMKTFWKATGIQLGKIVDEIGDDTYDVRIGKHCYPILMAADFAEERNLPGHLWGIAGYRASLVINRILRGHERKERAYSVEGGNDHGFLLITPAMHDVVTSARDYERARGPYVATSRYPNYGMPSEY